MLFETVHVNQEYKNFYIYFLFLNGDVSRYTGGVDVHNKKPNGNGEMMFKNGDWFCGQFQARAKQIYLQLVNAQYVVEWFKTWNRSDEIEY